MTRHIKTLLPNFINRSTNWQHQLLQNWHHIVGPLHQQVVIEKIIPPLLILGVQDSCLLQELYLLSPILLRKITETLDHDHIKQIRLKLASTPMHLAPKRRESSVHQKKHMGIPMPITHQNALKKITNPALREALEKFWLHCFQENQ